MSAPHIGYVLKMYPRLSETFILNEILELERQGARVTIFSVRTAREGRFHEKLARVTADVVYLADRGPAELLRLLAETRADIRPVRERLAEMFWEEIERSKTPSVRSLAKSLEVASEIRHRGVDHLHAHFATVAADVARGASLLTGVPYSVTAHAKDIYLETHDPQVMRRRLGDAAFVVTVCDANRAAVTRHAGPDTPVRRIYNGLDLAEFEAIQPGGSGTYTILGVGRLVPKKGFDLLIRACRRLRDDGVNFTCRIAGDGEEGEALRQLARHEGVASDVTFLGPLSNESVRREMIRADVLALPCRIAEDGNRDALPTVLLEAMAIGLPFVSTPVTGIPEIAGSEEGGRLVPIESPGDLADALADLADSPEQRRDLGRAGRARAERLFDGRRNVAELLELFRASAFAGPAGEVAKCVSST